MNVLTLCVFFLLYILAAVASANFAASVYWQPCRQLIFLPACIGSTAVSWFCPIISCHVLSLTRSLSTLVNTFDAILRRPYCVEVMAGNLKMWSECKGVDKKNWILLVHILKFKKAHIKLKQWERKYIAFKSRGKKRELKIIRLPITKNRVKTDYSCTYESQTCVFTWEGVEEMRLKEVSGVIKGYLQRV